MLLNPVVVSESTDTDTQSLTTNGHTCLDRMPAGTKPTNVVEYKGTGRAWRYG